MLCCTDQGFVAIGAMALNAATSGSILAEPEGQLGNQDGIAIGST
jgi:hypothetical protein